MQRTGHLIAKKNMRNKIYFTNKFEHVVRVTFVLHFSFPAFNSTLNHIKNIQLDSNLSLIA